MKTKKITLSREAPIKFQMNPLIANIAGATQRNKESLECLFAAIEKYNAACLKASVTMSKDIESCRNKLYPKAKPGALAKK